MMSASDSTRLVLSTDELLCLARLCEVVLPAGLHLDGVLSESPRELGASQAAAFRSLLARGLLSVADGPVVAVPAGLRALLQIVGTPDVIAVVRREAAGQLTMSIFCVAQGLAVERRLSASGLNVLMTFSESEFVDRVCVAARLLERPISKAPGFDLSVDDLDRFGAALLQNGVKAAAEVLRNAGAAAPAAKAFASAAAKRVGTSDVLMLRRTNGAKVEGIQSAWIDGGPSGLWDVPAFDRSPFVEGSWSVFDADAIAQRTTVTPTSADAIRSELAEAARQ